MSDVIEAPAPAPAAPAPSPAPAPAPAAPPAPSAIATGAEWTHESIPEKLRVNGQDGQLDLQATIRKVDEHRASLERRMGAGDIRPKSADEYTLPESFKDLPLDAEATAAFRKEAHEMGLSQKQYEGIMSKWQALAPDLVAAGAKESADSTIATLRETWKDDFDVEMRGAFRTAQAVAEKAGMDWSDVDKAIGNNPTAIRLFAALSKEMSEDRTPAAANGGSPASGASSAEQYMAENFAAFTDPKNPKHKEVTQRYQSMLAREVKD